VGLAVGFCGAFAAWVVFLRIIPVFGVWIIDPRMVAIAIDLISEQGVWDNQPTGIWLKLIYVVEALSIMTSSAIVASLETRPFCDQCNAWTEQIKPVAILKPTDQNVLREQLEDAQYEALDALLDPAVDRSDCLHAKLFKCPRCSESNYLVVSHVTVVEKKGETRQSEDAFVKYLWVPEEVEEQLARLHKRLQQAAVAEVDADAGDDDQTPDAVDSA
jgi:hypothetical protein